MGANRSFRDGARHHASQAAGHQDGDAQVAQATDGYRPRPQRGAWQIPTAGLTLRHCADSQRKSEKRRPRYLGGCRRAFPALCSLLHSNPSPNGVSPLCRGSDSAPTTGTPASNRANVTKTDRRQAAHTGIKRTNSAGLTMSVRRSRPEVAFRDRQDRF